MTLLREVAELFGEVWGRNSEGLPMPSEVLRSLAHAGGLVTAGYDDATGALLGAAVLGRDEPGSAYGYIAAATPGAGDRGIGFALKQHQRAWCLTRDITRIRWTFDPLVSRNARFNLSKLGAVVTTYEPAFYGRMSDALNGDDPADRLVADWRLDSDRAVAAAEGALTPPSGPPGETDAPGVGDEQDRGPDGLPAWRRSGAEAWCRVPTDIVELRRLDPATASAWRTQVRGRLTAAFDQGWIADGANHQGWYHLTSPRTDGRGPSS